MLANELGLTTGSTTSLVDRFELAGLVRRGRDESDRRRNMVHLSDTADERLISAHTWLTQACEVIAPEEWEQLARDLHTLAFSLRAAPASPPTARDMVGDEESTPGRQTTPDVWGGLPPDSGELAS